MPEAPKVEAPKELSRSALHAPPEPQIKRGVIVWFQNNYDNEPNPAIITHVWVNEGEKLVNLTVFDRDGEARAATKVWRGASVGTWRPVGASE